MTSLPLRTGPRRPFGVAHDSDHRVPPHNLEAERSALSAAMAKADAAETLVNLLDPGAFYDAKHQHIADAICRLYAVGDEVDPVTVGEQLRRTGLLEQAGGHQYLGELLALVASTSAAGHYCDIVADLAALRKVLGTAADITSAAYAGDIDTAVQLGQQIAEHRPISAPREVFVTLDSLTGADAAAPEATLLRRTDGRALLYEARENVFMGEPGSGKSWGALLAATEVVDDERTVVYFDLEDKAATARARLVQLGMRTEGLARVWHTSGRDITTGDPLEMSALAALLVESNPALVIVDSIAEAFTRWGLDENEAADVNTFREGFVKPITRIGSTVLCLDHVSKSTEQRGKYARGSGAKLAGIDGAAYAVSSHGFNKTTAGRITLKLSKDRHGALPGVVNDVLASIWMEPGSGPLGDTMRATVEIPVNDRPSTPADKTAVRTAADHQLHDALRASALAAITAAGAPLSRRELLDRIRSERRKQGLAGFDDKKLGAPLEDLRAAGQIVTVPGKGGHDRYALPPLQQTLPGSPKATS